MKYDGGSQAGLHIIVSIAIQRQTAWLALQRAATLTPRASSLTDVYHGFTQRLQQNGLICDRFTLHTSRKTSCYVAS
jgi:hypothetical protein